MDQDPAVTIAIPTYNRISYLPQAILSALSQTYPHIQVIVSDNCSEDGTAAYISSIHDGRLLSLHQSTNLGMAGNWNACLERATGEFFLLLSDDDYLEKDAIRKMVQAVTGADQPDRIGFAYCRLWEVDSDGNRLRIEACPAPEENAKDFALQYFRRKRSLRPCNTLLRTSSLRQIGGYSQDSLTLAVDAIAWSRVLLQRGKAVGVPDAFSNYRIHQKNITSVSSIRIWQYEIRAFAGVWDEALRDGPAGVQRGFRKAARDYESWSIAASINQSAHSWAGRIRALGKYYLCRDSFLGFSGMINLLGGMVKLLTPEGLKAPIRRFLLSYRAAAANINQES